MADMLNEKTNEWSRLQVIKLVLLAAANGVLFFISEHNVLMSTSEAFVEEIENQEAWAAGGNRLRQLSFLLCAGIGMLGFLIGRLKHFRLNPPVVFVAMYVLLAGLSLNWSIDPGASFRRYSVMLCCIIGCFGITQFFRVKDIVLAAMLVSLSYLFVGVATEIFLGEFKPHLGSYRFAGTIHPNNQAANLAIGSIAAYTMARILPKAKGVFYCVFCILFLFLILTRCRSATATVPVALGIIWFTAQSPQRIFVGLFGGAFLVSVTVLTCIVLGSNPITDNQDILLMGRGEETGASLTGRLPLWEDLMSYIAYRPWLGYGYDAFWTPRHIYEIAVSQEWVISEAHSSYFETTLHLGIIGCLLMVLIALTTFFYAAGVFRRTRAPEYLFLVGGVFYCIVRGFTESGVSDPSFLVSFLFLAWGAHTGSGSEKLIDTTARRNDDQFPPQQNKSPLDLSGVTNG